MESIPDRLLVSTTIEELRQQKVRLWVKSLILSILLGIFIICTAVLAVLYATKTYAVSPVPTASLSTCLPTIAVSSETGTTVTVSESGTTVTVTKTATKTHMETTTASSEATTTASSEITTTVISVTTSTSVLRPTRTASSQPGPRIMCPSGTVQFGDDLIDDDHDYYFGQMKFAMQNNPNLVPDKGYDDDKIMDLVVKSVWRCGDNGWIAFLWNCQGTITIDDHSKSCKDDDRATTIPT